MCEAAFQNLNGNTDRAGRNATGKAPFGPSRRMQPWIPTHHTEGKMTIKIFLLSVAYASSCIQGPVTGVGSNCKSEMRVKGNAAQYVSVRTREGCQSHDRASKGFSRISLSTSDYASASLRAHPVKQPKSVLEEQWLGLLYTPFSFTTTTTSL
jgi:hypothetical protein